MLELDVISGSLSDIHANVVGLKAYLTHFLAFATHQAFVGHCIHSAGIVALELPYQIDSSVLAILLVG